MYSTIMIPIDLENIPRMEKALTVGVDLAGMYDTELHLVGVTQSSPTVIARSPEDYAEKLSNFADECSAKYKKAFQSHAKISHDITRDLDDVLKHVADTIDADLIVMASHIPGFGDYFFSSNAGYLASHSKLSVFVVR